MWPDCSKLTTSLVNVSLKFQTSISQIRRFYPSLKLLFLIFLYCMFSNFLRLVTVLLDFSHFFTILVLLPKFLVHTLLLAIQSQV